jgi:phospholipid transport system transporter-binding protein
MSAPLSTPEPAAAGREATAGTFRLTSSADGHFAAAGPLTFATARRAREIGLRCLAQVPQGALEIDCGGVKPTDSAGLAVLLDWLGAAKRAGRTLRYTQLPQELTALGHISEVDDLLTRGV